MTDKPMTAEESIPFIEESIKCTLQSLYEVKKSVGKVDHAKMIAYAMCNIETSINILRRTEEDLKFYLVEHLKND